MPTIKELAIQLFEQGMKPEEVFEKLKSQGVCKDRGYIVNEVYPNWKRLKELGEQLGVGDSPSDISLPLRYCYVCGKPIKTAYTVIETEMPPKVFSSRTAAETYIQQRKKIYPWKEYKIICSDEGIYIGKGLYRHRRCRFKVIKNAYNKYVLPYKNLYSNGWFSVRF